MRDSGQPGDPTSDDARGARVRGNLKTHARGNAGRCRIRGDPETHHEETLKSEDSGQPGDSFAAPPKDARFGETRDSIAGKPEDAGFGATRRLIGGDTGEAKIRGNLGLRLQCHRRMRKSGQPEAPSPAQLEDAGFGATRMLIGRLNGTMHDPSNLQDHRD